MVAMPSWLSGGYSDGLQTVRGTVRCAISVAIGSTGAPTLVDGVGFVTVTRVSAGLYRFALVAGRVNRILKATPTVDLVAATTGGVWAAKTTDSGTSNTAPLFEVTCYAAGGVTATDPASGNTLTVDLQVAMQAA